MAVFPGITKRNWLAFALIAILLATSLSQIWITYLAQDASWKNLSDAKFPFIFLLSIAMLVLFIVIADLTSGYLIQQFGLKMQKRYLAALMFVLANILRGLADWGFPLSNLPLLIFLSIVGGVIVLLLYVLSDFVPNIVILFSQSKSKSNAKVKSIKKKSKN